LARVNTRALRLAMLDRERPTPHAHYAQLAGPQRCIAALGCRKRSTLIDDAMSDRISRFESSPKRS